MIVISAANTLEWRSVLLLRSIWVAADDLAALTTDIGDPDNRLINDLGLFASEREGTALWTFELLVPELEGQEAEEDSEGIAATAKKRGRNQDGMTFTKSKRETPPNTARAPNIA